MIDASKMMSVCLVSLDSYCCCKWFRLWQRSVWAPIWT